MKGTAEQSHLAGGTRPYAGVGKRIGAYLIDGLLFSAVAALVALMAGLGSAMDKPRFLHLGIFLGFALSIVVTILLIVGVAKRGQTPGMRLLGIAVLGVEDQLPLGAGRATIRHLLLGVLAPFHVFHVFLIAAHAKRQGLHDRAARSTAFEGGPYVAKRPPPLRPLLAEGRLFAAPLPASPADRQPLTRRGAPPPARSTAGQPGIPSVPPPPPSSTSVPSPAPTVLPPAGASVQSTPFAAPVQPAAPQRATPRWALVAADGLRIELTAATLVGRDPDAQLVDGARGFRVDDPSFTVSRTHALFGTDDQVAWVEDWHSSNGVAITRDSQTRQLEPRTRTPLRNGDDVLLGDYRLQVRNNL